MIDWDSVDVEKARRCLYTCHTSEQSMEELKKFIKTVELIKKSQVKQVAKLLEKPNGL
jgi:hypothetical protein